MSENVTSVLVRFSGFASGGLVTGSILEGEQTGKRVFASGAVPGEEARVKITLDQGRFAEGVVESVQLPSANRVVPPCPLFSDCGGCDYQHIAPQAQRELKVAMVRDMLLHHGKIEPKGGVNLLGKELPFLGYRRRATFHLALNGDLGFYRRSTSVVVDCESCLVVEPAINEVLKVIRPFTQGLAAACSSISFEQEKGGVWVVLSLREGFRPAALEQAATPLVREGLSVAVCVEDRVMKAYRGGKEIEPSVFENAIGHFSQGNRLGNELLVRHVVSQFVGIPEVTEFYAGSGNFTFPIAASGVAIQAIEVDGDLVASGEYLARERGMEAQVRFHKASTEHYLKYNKVRGAVLLDPPRSGAKSLAQALSPGSVSQVVYVSCNLPTLSRDLVTLTKKGFVVQEVAVIDLFPQTHHVETVSVLKRA